LFIEEEIFLGIIFHELSKEIDLDKFNQMAQKAHDTEDVFDENGKLIG
jgi:hypothetical protein